MVGEGGAKKLAVIKELKERPFTAKPMEAVAAASTSAAPRAQKVALSTASHMEVATVAGTKIAPEPQGENLACAFAMVAAKGAKGRTA